MTARRQGHGNTESVDNYLKAILFLEGGEKRRVSSKALAERLGVAPASVTNMLQKLAAATAPLVEYERHRGVLLSPGGRKRALEVLRHHRLIETFLYEVLDYRIDEVHDEAERLEHFISERFEERIAAKLGHPKIDPHGHGIPALDGAMPRQNSVPLTEVAGEGVYVVGSVSDLDAGVLKSLKLSGVAAGVRLRMRGMRDAKGKDEYAVSVGRSAKVLHLSRKAAEAIRVQAVEGRE